MTPLSYKLLYILNSVRLHPVRFTFLLLSIGFLCFTSYNPKYEVKIKIINQFKYADEWIYVYKDINNNRVEYLTISSSEPLPMKGDILTRNYHSPANTLIWAGFIISLVISLLIFLLDDWDANDVFEVTLSRFVVVELEEGKLYYFVFDRFMGTRDTPHQNPISYFSIRKLDHIRMLPKMQTKTMRRSKLLEEIVP